MFAGWLRALGSACAQVVVSIVEQSSSGSCCARTRRFCDGGVRASEWELSSLSSFAHPLPAATRSSNPA